jgi:protein-S-isoprenylcysteine O-methyltransferase Ste14
MFDKLYLFSILLFFILAFAIRNIKTALNTRLSIKGKSAKVNLSVLLSSIIYVMIILRLFHFSDYDLLEVETFKIQIIKYIGFALVSVGFIMGILALIAMKNSRRVGIRYEQKTDLITNGIYKFSRNPYFLSYNVLMFGFLLIFPSIFLLIPYVFLVLLFHQMILEEESYIENMHGEEYLNYKRKVKRYITVANS